MGLFPDTRDVIAAWRVGNLTAENCVGADGDEAKMSSDIPNPRRVWPWGKPLSRFESPQEEQARSGLRTRSRDPLQWSATSSFPSSLAGYHVHARFRRRHGPGLEASSAQRSVPSLVWLEQPSVEASAPQWSPMSVPCDRGTGSGKTRVSERGSHVSASHRLRRSRICRTHSRREMSRSTASRSSRVRSAQLHEATPC